MAGGTRLRSQMNWQLAVDNSNSVGAWRRMASNRHREEPCRIPVEQQEISNSILISCGIAPFALLTVPIHHQ